MSAVPVPSPTALDQLDQVVQRLKEQSRAFAALSIGERIRLLEKMRHGYHALAEEVVRQACRAKGIDPDSPLSGEEWLAGPVITLRTMRLTQESLQQIHRSGVPRVEPGWLRTLPDGRLAVRVYPRDNLDAMLLIKSSIEAYLQPGVTAENLRQHQARFYQRPHQGRLCLVLGAGNVNAIPPTDCIYKMFVEGAVCLLKMNPVNAYLGPLLERAFRPAIEKGFFAVVYGGAEEGGYLVQHPLVDEVHITGSDQTHDRMVWGPPGPEREARKQRHEPLLKKEITSELGNVSPVIVVPGPFSQSELSFQAFNVAGMVANNASFNCNSAKLLVCPQGWEGRERFLDLVAQGLSRAGVRRAYYPGAEERFRAFTEGRPGVRMVGKAGPGELPYAMITGMDPQGSERLFRQEPWCTVLGETALGSSDPLSFLAEAVRFVNERVWGTLCATLIVSPGSLADPAVAGALEQAIRDLRYGAVAVNSWPAAVFGIGSAPWGGHPSSSLRDIQSGRGFVHNSLMLDSVEKCVLRAPAKVFPIPFWFPGHRTLNQLSRRLVELEMDPSWLKMPSVAAAAVRG